MAQLKQLQLKLTGTGRRTAQTGTCLAVLLLSFALLVAPSWSPLKPSAEMAPTSDGAGSAADGLGNGSEMPATVDENPMKPTPMAGKNRIWIIV